MSNIKLNCQIVEEIISQTDEFSNLITEYREHYEMILSCHNDSPRLNWVHWTTSPGDVEVNLSVTSNANSDFNVAYSVSNTDVWIPCSANTAEIIWDIDGYSCIKYSRNDLDINTVATLLFTGRLISNNDMTVFRTPLYLHNE